jgi:hypothetical protein
MNEKSIVMKFSNKLSSQRTEVECFQWEIERSLGWNRQKSEENTEDFGLDQEGLEWVRVSLQMQNLKWYFVLPEQIHSLEQTPFIEENSQSFWKQTLNRPL